MYFTIVNVHIKFELLSQAAKEDPGVPNPFMASESDLFAPVSGAVIPPVSQTSVTPPVSGAPTISTTGSTGPPLRPPPPQPAQAGISVPTSSPAKSAFDDLNDSIRMALGGSPGHPPQSQTQAPIVQQPQQQSIQTSQQQPIFNAFDFGGSQTTSGFVSNVGFPGAMPGYGSPAKQSLPATGRKYWVA